MNSDKLQTQLADKQAGRPRLAKRIVRRARLWMRFTCRFTVVGQGRREGHRC